MVYQSKASFNDNIDVYDAQRQFIEAMHGRSLKLSRDLFADGQFHRCDAANKEGSHGKDDGSYVLNIDGVPRGAFTNFTDGRGIETWVYKTTRPLTPEERRDFSREVKEAMAKAAANLRERYEYAQRRARHWWKIAEPATNDHPYLRDKDVEAYRLRIDVRLLIPIYGSDFKLCNLQTIEDDGKKMFLEGGRVGGCFYCISKAKGDAGIIICIAEGYATAASIHEATGYQVFVAFCDWNLKDVAKWVRKRYPDACIVICADDDWKTENNPGVRYAKKAARAVGGYVAIPTFGDDREDGEKDFNDMMCRGAGIEAVKQVIDAAAAQEEPEQEEPDPESSNDKEERETRLNALAALKLDDPLAYDQQRNDAADDLGVRVKTLDEEVERRCKQLKAEQEEEPPPPVDIEQLAESARDIIACENVLERFAKECGRKITGEVKILKLLYLIGTSRLFDQKACMNGAVKGPSAAGKSETRQTVVDFFPPESVVEFTSFTEKALIYHQDDFQHKILSMGEAHGREEREFQNMLLRVLMSEGKLRHLAAMKVGDKIQTVMIEKNGPVAFLVTTARNNLDAENETRLLSLEIDDCEQQTRKVLRKLAVTKGLNRTSRIDLNPWHDYQRWLAAGEVRVTVPFAETLVRLFPNTKSVRLRRDFGQLLLALQVHALLHREHRKQDDDGIIATIDDDYAIIRDLMADLLATASELKMRQQIADTIAAVQELAAGRIGDTAGAKVREIADKLKLDVSAAWRRVRAAEDLGFVVNLEEHKGRGRQGRYRVDGVYEELTGTLLPEPDELRKAYRKVVVEAQRERTNDHSGSRPQEKRSGA